jgi:hypothetical protein
MAPTQFPIVTICGSMRYYHEMLIQAKQWSRDGWIVLMPFDVSYMGGAPSDDTKAMLDDMHYTKMSMSELILIVGDHIGESTTNEIRYAVLHEIPIQYTHRNGRQSGQHRKPRKK